MKRDANPTTGVTARRTRPSSVLPRRGRRLPALLGIIALALLAGCFQSGPPPEVTLAAPNRVMHGFTQAQVQVTAPGAWTLEVLPTDTTLSGGVTTSPSGGNGAGTATVIVNAAAMPRVPVTFRLRLTATAAGKQIVRTSEEFTFSYPDVNGVVEGGPNALGVLGGLGVSSREAPITPASTPDPRLQALETTTLIVGLEPTGVVLGIEGVSGARLDSAKLEVASALTSLGLATTSDPFDEANLTLVTVPTGSAEAAAAALRATPGVRYVDFPRLLEPASNDPLRSQQWNLDQLGVEPLWGVAGGGGVTIAVLDLGFMPHHPDLFANVLGTYDAVLGGPIQAPVAACATHGTHVAGIAAAVTNNGEGVAGVAPYAKLLLVNLGDARLADCAMNTSTLINAIQYVTNNGAPRAEVINMSLGGASDFGSGVRDALAAAADLGISLVAAAGNTVDNGKCPPAPRPVNYPAAYPTVLAVAATDPDGTHSCYSNVGPQLFIAAPGGSLTEGVLSTVVTFPGAIPDYGPETGTSMAAPAVAGVIAMLRSAMPTASAAQVAAAIQDSASDRGAVGRDSQYGYGFINPAGAYDALIGSPPPPPVPVTDLILRVPGYPDALLDADGIFTLLYAAPGPLTIEVGSDDNGNGILGEPGEWYGAQTIDVGFGVFAPDPGNVVNIVVALVP